MKGTIYRIFSPHKSDIGSTTKHLQHRLAQHLVSYYDYDRSKAKYCSVFEVFKDDSYIIESLAEVEYADPVELKQLEQYWISQYNNCVNKNKAYIELNLKKKDDYNQYHREYYHANREKALAIKRRYYLRKHEIMSRLREGANQSPPPVAEDMLSVSHNILPSASVSIPLDVSHNIP